MIKKSLLISFFSVFLSVNAVAVDGSTTQTNSSSAVWPYLAVGAVAAAATWVVDPTWGYVAGTAVVAAAVAVGGNALCARNAEAHARVDPSTDEFIGAFEPQFDRFGQFAVMNADHYPHLIHSNEARAAVLARAKAPIYNQVVQQAQARSLSMATALQQEARRPVEESDVLEAKSKILNMMRQVRESVEKGKAGACTTFAFAAADVLTRSGAESEMRVEVVARRAPEFGGTHLFVLVGRARASDLNDVSTWGNQTRIVDLWFRALRNNEMDSTMTIEQYRKMLDNLESVYDNFAF